MKHLYLTIAPDFLTTDRFIQYFLLNEKNLSEFFNRIGAICFHDYCTFYYSPEQYRGIVGFLEDIDALGHKTRFLRLLGGKNIEEVDVQQVDGDLFKYFGYGNFYKMLSSEAAIAIYEQENIALLDFEEKSEATSGQIQTIMDKEGELQPPKQWKIITSYAAFLEWSLGLNPRTFDESMDMKHAAGGKTGFGSALLCPKEVAKDILKIAFFKKADHENHLFFYHLNKADHPILWFKAAKPSFDFHGFHIKIEEVRLKGIDDFDLKRYSEYVKNAVL